MKTLYNYINNILEGGHALSHIVSPIPAEISGKLYQEIENKIKQVDKNLEIAVLGSVGKKRTGDTNGDIDIAVGISDKNKLENIIKKTFGDVEYATASMPNIVSIAYSYDYKGTTMYAQVDFMMVDDVEWARFIYSSPDYTKDESHYKAALRNHLLSIMVSEIPIDELPEKDEDGNYITRWKHSLDFAFGITKQFLDYRGKKGLLKNPKKIKELETIVTQNKSDFISILFNNGTEQDFTSLESVWKALHEKYKYPEKVKFIEQRFFDEVLDRNDLSREEFLKYVK